MRATWAFMLVMGILLTGCAADGGRIALSGPYEAGAHEYTVDGHPVVCDTAGFIGRSVTRCF